MMLPVRARVERRQGAVGTARGTEASTASGSTKHGVVGIVIAWGRRLRLAREDATSSPQRCSGRARGGRRSRVAVGVSSAPAPAPAPAAPREHAPGHHEDLRHGIRAQLLAHHSRGLGLQGGRELGRHRGHGAAASRVVGALRTHGSHHHLVLLVVHHLLLLLLVVMVVLRLVAVLLMVIVAAAACCHRRHLASARRGEIAQRVLAPHRHDDVVAGVATVLLLLLLLVVLLLRQLLLLQQLLLSVRCVAARGTGRPVAAGGSRGPVVASAPMARGLGLSVHLLMLQRRLVDRLLSSVVTCQAAACILVHPRWQAAFRRCVKRVERRVRKQVAARAAAVQEDAHPHPARPDAASTSGCSAAAGNDGRALGGEKALRHAALGARRRSD